MNSLEMYRSLRISADPPQIKALHADRLIACVVEEVYRHPCLLRNSPFLREIQSGTSVSLMDAYILTAGVLRRMQDPEFRAGNEFSRYMCYLFTGASGKNDARMRDEIRRSLRAVKLLLPKNGSETFRTESSSSVYEKERLRLLQEHTERRSTAAENWHDGQKELHETLNTVRPAAQDILKHLLSLEERLTKDYILTFARIQIHQ